MTIREIIKQLLTEIQATENLQGEPATEYLYKLSALLGNVGEKIVEYEMEFIGIQNTLLTQHPQMPIARVKLLAQGSESYKNLQECKALRETMVETIRALKYRVKSLQEEYQNTTR